MPSALVFIFWLFALGGWEWPCVCVNALDGSTDDEPFSDPDMFYTSGGPTENLLGYIGLSAPTGSNVWVKHDTHLALSMAYNDSKALLYPYRIAVVYIDSGECSMPMAVESVLDVAGHVNLRGNGSTPPFLAFLGGWCRASTKALSVFTSTFGIPQITYGPMMDSVESNAQRSWLFHMYPSAREESLFLVTLVEWFHWTSVTILASADQYSQALSTFVRDHLANLDDVQLVSRQVYTDSVELDRAMIIIRQLEPADVIIVLSEDCDEVVLAAHRAGLVERSRMWLTNRDCLLNANASTRAFFNATLFTIPAFYGSEGDDFISRFSKIRGSKPGDMSAAYVYDAAMAVFSIAAMASRMGVALNGDEMTTRLRKATLVGVAGKLSFNQYGERINTISNVYTQRLTSHITAPSDGSRVMLPITTPIFNNATGTVLLQTQKVGRELYDDETSARIVLDNGNTVTGLWSFITGKEPLDNGGGPGTTSPQHEGADDGSDIGSIPWIWAILGVSVTIVFVAGVFVCRRLYRFMLQREKLKQQSSARIAAECIAAIPRLNVDAVEWIHTIEQPDPVQIGFIRMVQVLKSVRPFITDALRQLLSEDEFDDEPSSLIEHIRTGGGGGSRSDVSKPPSLGSLDRSCASTLESIIDPVRRMNIICGKPSASSILSDSVWVCRTVVALVARFEFPFAFHGMEQTYVSAIRAMVSAIKAHRGTIESVSAYGLIAHWGAVHQMSHSQAAKKACDAAVQLHESLTTLSKDSVCFSGMVMGECKAGTLSDPDYGAFLVIGHPMFLARKMAEAWFRKILNVPILINKKLQTQLRHHSSYKTRLVHIFDGDGAMVDPKPLYSLELPPRPATSPSCGPVPTNGDNSPETETETRGGPNNNSNPGGQADGMVDDENLNLALKAFMSGQVESARTHLTVHQRTHPNGGPGRILAVQLAQFPSGSGASSALGSTSVSLREQPSMQPHPQSITPMCRTVECRGEDCRGGSAASVPHPIHTSGQTGEMRPSNHPTSRSSTPPTSSSSSQASSSAPALGAGSEAHTATAAAAAIRPAASGPNS